MHHDELPDGEHHACIHPGLSLRPTIPVSFLTGLLGSLNSMLPFNFTRMRLLVRASKGIIARAVPVHASMSFAFTNNSVDADVTHVTPVAYSGVAAYRTVWQTFCI